MEDGVNMRWKQASIYINMQDQLMMLAKLETYYRSEICIKWKSFLLKIQLQEYKRGMIAANLQEQN